jgi:hypothetical protein
VKWQLGTAENFRDMSEIALQATRRPIGLTPNNALNRILLEMRQGFFIIRKW